MEALDTISTPTKTALSVIEQLFFSQGGGNKAIVISKEGQKVVRWEPNKLSCLHRTQCKEELNIPIPQVTIADNPKIRKDPRFSFFIAIGDFSEIVNGVRVTVRKCFVEEQHPHEDGLHFKRITAHRLSELVSLCE